jgi:tRNA(His) 5'-end guanylyltransferase
MIGMALRHWSGIMGFVAAQSVHPDCRVLVRIDGHWFFADECLAA